jgi:hypothetical protein
MSARLPDAECRRIRQTLVMDRGDSRAGGASSAAKHLGLGEILEQQP